MATPTDTPMLTDSEGRVIPQVWNPVAEAYEAVFGAGGSQEAQLTSTTVEIGATTFRLVNGNEIYGLAANKPSAADAATAVGVGAIYVSINAEGGPLFEMTDGTNWVAL